MADARPDRPPRSEYPDPAQPYWDAAANGELRLPRCLDCGHRMFPPSPNCTECLSERLEWERLSGRGTVFSFVVYHRAWQRAFADKIPYNVAIIALEEGPHIISAVTGCPLSDITVGMAVTVTFEREGDRTLPKFTPLEAQ